MPGAQHSPVLRTAPKSLGKDWKNVLSQAIRYHEEAAYGGRIEDDLISNAQYQEETYLLAEIAQASAQAQVLLSKYGRAAIHVPAYCAALTDVFTAADLLHEHAVARLRRLVLPGTEKQVG